MSEGSCKYCTEVKANGEYPLCHLCNENVDLKSTWKNTNFVFVNSWFYHFNCYISDMRKTDKENTKVESSDEEPSENEVPSENEEPTVNNFNALSNIADRLSEITIKFK